MARHRTPRPHRPPTLATVAAALGVSRMTVSNAFNRPDQLSPALRQRVLAAARELGYAGPDPVARTLSRGETGSVGLVFDYPLTLALADPATVELLHGVADGFVLYCVMEGDARMQAVRDRRLPYVLIDHEPLAGAHRVNIDDRGAARSM